MGWLVSRLAAASEKLARHVQLLIARPAVRGQNSVQPAAEPADTIARVPFNLSRFISRQFP